MEECSHCGETFDDEKSYLRHLRDEHEGELGRIDRQRVTQLDDGGPSRTTLYAVVALLGIVIVGIAYMSFAGGGGGGGGEPLEDPTGIEAEPLPDSGDQALLADVQTLQSQGKDHVSGDVDYERVPPTSGLHAGSTVRPGFYESPQQYEELVHNLEHGHVVIYYDPAALTNESESSLKQFAAAHDDGWAAVVVVPNPEDDPDAPFVLTAWTKKLEMDDYDPEVVRAFLAEYIGRGPENPVRE